MVCNRITEACLFTLFIGAVTSFEDADFWLKEGQKRLQSKLLHENNIHSARNVIIFIGDGMGINSVTAARIYQGQRHGGNGEENQLSFERFPHVGLSKTYDVDKQVADSAATATAILTGVKVKHRSLGLAPEAPADPCDPALKEDQHQILGLASWAQEAGKATGFVTTTRVTHATPGALYAHITNRDWECDTLIPSNKRECVKDVAKQLVEDNPGNRFNVILGGGQNEMGVAHEVNNDCVRTDGKNLVNEWLLGKNNALYVNSSSSLMDVDIKNTEHLIGLFSPEHMPYVEERTQEHPSLINMTLQAIKILKKRKHGFFLLVEAGRIDQGHHGNMARKALREACELDETVSATMSITDPEDTLIIVTADHSHSFTMNGYPERGNDILGFANKKDQPVYETLSYANGPGYLVHRVNDTSNTNETWRPLSELDRTSNTYRNLATIYLKSETHGGEDVGVFSTGPFSHLLTGTFEQNYIAHATAYAACIGPFANHCKKYQHPQTRSSAQRHHICFVHILVISIAVFSAIHQY